MTLEELKKAEGEAWERLQEIEDKAQPIRAQWANLHRKLEHEELRAKLFAEFQAEKEAK